MLKNRKGFCTACTRGNFKCNRGKPRCTNCVERATKCGYSFTLRWGGRKYKGGDMASKIPNTKFYKGALLVKEKCLIAGKKTQKIKQFLPYGEEEGPLKALERVQIRTDHEAEELSLIPARAKLLAPKEIDRGTAPDFGCFPSSLPMPINVHEFAENSWEFSILFDLFVNETSQFFVGLNTRIFPNPYRTILPRMALSCPTLLKLVLAFGATHRKMISVCEEENKFKSLEGELPMTDFGSIGEVLLRQALLELVKKLECSTGTFDDCTMAIVLLFSSLHIFFNSGRGDWRRHYNGAKLIAFNWLKLNKDLENPAIYYGRDLKPHFFLMRWFIYLDVVGCLSSASFSSKMDTFRPEFEFVSMDDANSDENSMENLEDINPLSGMDLNILGYLTKISQLILQKEKYHETSEDYYKLIGEAINLDYKVLNYLKKIKLERDQILEKHKRRRMKQHNSALDCRISDYNLLRTTNLIIGLTGVLQLRRRVVKMSADSELVKTLVLKITKLVAQRMPKNSPALSCITYCLFIVGSELRDDTLALYRHAYLERLDSLWKKGYSSVSQAVKVMEESWRSKKSWWCILEEKNLDICLAF